MARRQVLHALLESAPGDTYGLELIRVTGLKSGTLYPILDRLETSAWVESRWEDVDPSDAGRPRRRLYRLTPNGVIHAREAMKEMAMMFGFRPIGDGA